jgi:hypothetical protein
VIGCGGATTKVIKWLGIAYKFYALIFWPGCLIIFDNFFQTVQWISFLKLNLENVRQLMQLETKSVSFLNNNFESFKTTLKKPK